jgi:hypothetical protein
LARLLDGSGVSREAHAPFCERLGVRVPRSTHHENNNVLQTKGDHLEHNFGPGKRYLVAFRLRLNLLAFLFHTGLPWCDAK